MTFSIGPHPSPVEPSWEELLESLACRVRWLFAVAVLLCASAAAFSQQGSRDFDGDNDYMDFGGNTPTAISNMDNGSFTVCAWVYPETMGEGDLGTIYDNLVSSSGGFAFLLRAVDDSGTQQTFQISVSCDSDTSLTSRGGTSAQDFNLSEWSYLCAAWDYSTPTAAFSDLFVNGVEISYAVQNSGNCTGTAVDDSDQAPRIGNILGGSTRTFDGQFAYLSIYDAYLTAPEQLQIMRCPFTHHPNRVGGPWPMMDATGAIDASGNANDLTNSGTTSSSNGPPVMLNCGGGG